MKKMIALLLSILMVCSLAACASKQDTAAATETASTETAASSSEEKTLTMATNVAFPPYEFYGNEKPAGIDVEIATAICENLRSRMASLNPANSSVVILRIRKTVIKADNWLSLYRPSEMFNKTCLASSLERLLCPNILYNSSFIVINISYTFPLLQACNQFAIIIFPIGVKIDSG